MVSLWVRILANFQLLEVELFIIGVQVIVILGIALGFFLIFTSLATMNAKRVFNYFPSELHFFIIMLLIRPQLPCTYEKVVFMDLEFSHMTVLEFILYPGPWRCQVGLFSYSEGFTSCFGPNFFWSIESDWWYSQDYLNL